MSERGAKAGVEGESGGLECSHCGCRDLRVQSTRKWYKGKVLRVRVCRHCGRQVRTVERVAGG